MGQQSGDEPEPSAPSGDAAARSYAEERLRASEARLRQIIDLVPHFIFAKDEEGRFLLVNRAVADAFGAAVEDVLGKTDADFVEDEEQVRAFRADDLRVMESGRSVYVPEETITDADGAVRWLQTYKVPYTESGTDRPAILGVAVDITDRKHAEEERLALEAELRESQRLESLGRLAGGVAHDFNNLLQVILGNVDLASEELAEGDPDAARAALEQGVVACRRAAELCNQMLVYAGRSAPVVAPVDLTSVVDEMLQLLSVSMPKGVRIERELAATPPVLGDASQLRQIALNLLTNAADALEGGEGRIRVATSEARLSAEQLADFRGDPRPRPGRWVWLLVEDDGRGMDEEQVARVFDPFFTTKPRGHGLGLAAVRGIVSGHGGAVRVTSRPGGGTRVQVVLPPCPPGWTAAPEPPPAPRPAAAEAFRGRALVVDDEEAVRRVVARVLERAGFDVVSVADGEAALSELERGGCALMVLDLNMPGMGGGELLALARERLPQLPVLVTSGYREPDALPDLFVLGPARFLPKPFRPQELIDAVARLLAEAASGPGA